MNPEVKAKWVAALRSGEYEQGTGVLDRDDKFCCLGVLCDLAVKEGVIPPAVPSVDGALTYGKRHEHSVLPIEVASWLWNEWLDGNANDGVNVLVRTEEGLDRSLTALNDSGETFEYISRLIETSEKLEPYFYG